MCTVGLIVGPKIKSEGKCMGRRKKTSEGTEIYRLVCYQNYRPLTHF